MAGDLTVQRIITVAVFWLFISIAADESEIYLSVTCKEVPLRTALELLSQKSGIAFVFSDQLVAEHRVTIHPDSSTLNEILDKILTPVRISYNLIENGPIVLFKTEDERADISGWIVDASSGRNLPFANIQVEGSHLGTAAGESGFFKLSNIPINEGRLKVSYIGYNSSSFSIQNPDSMVLALRENPVLMQEVVVSADHDRFRLTDNLKTGTTNSLPDIRTIPAATPNNMTQTLQYIPYTGTVSDKSSEFYILGGTPDQNLFVVESIPVYHVYHYFGFLSPFSTPPINNIQVFDTHMPPDQGGRLSSLFMMNTANRIPDNFRFHMGVDFFQINSFLEAPIGKNCSAFLSLKRSHDFFQDTQISQNIGDFIKSAVTAESELWDTKIHTRPIRFFDWMAGLNYQLPWESTRIKFAMLGTDETEEEVTERKRTDYRGTDIHESFDRTSTWRNQGLSVELNQVWSKKFKTRLNYSKARYKQNNTIIQSIEGSYEVL